MSLSYDPNLLCSRLQKLWKGFCISRISAAANCSKYLIKASKLEGKTLVFLKPCDTYSFNQLIKEHRISEKTLTSSAFGCDGKLDLGKDT